VDFFVCCGPEGYDNAYMRLFASRKRVQKTPWFALCGRVGNDDGDAFPIGRELVNFAPTRVGEVAFFANDHPEFYWNNFGRIPLLVARMK
jgi:hypothetical protein